MLKDPIISTLRFFDLQDYPLTLLELHRFLVGDIQTLKQNTDAQGEIIAENFNSAAGSLIDEILNCLDSECLAEIHNTFGFYHLAGRQELAKERLEGYFFGIRREKLIKRYMGGLKRLPFVRGVAIAGSQAMGRQKQGSDIDLLIITDPPFMWLTRTLVTGYFQVLGKRRYGQNIANRFCLNHYLAGPKQIGSLRNLYTASEYLKLRPLVYPHGVWQFQQNNSRWLKLFFPNAEFMEPEKGKAAKTQTVLEKLLGGGFGLWAEKVLKNWQLPKIRREKFIVVENDELSFHPESKQETLLPDFFKFQQ